jgi:SAM-dependent methyltransferase
VIGQAQAPGCAVALYERLPAGDEPDIIERAVPARARILELGCGVGRVTHPLAERGFVLTAVDESPEMLERVRGVRTICSPIEELDLGKRFDVVLPASFLVHAGDPQVRQELLQSCRRHVASRLGKLLPDVVSEAVECPEEPWTGPAEPGDIEIRFRKKSPLDVGDLDVVIEVRTKLFEHRVQDKQRRADLIRDRLSILALGQIGVWLILSEGAWSQNLKP